MIGKNLSYEIPLPIDASIPSLPPHKIKHRESQKRQMCPLLPAPKIYPLPIHCFHFPEIKPCWPPDYVGRAENSNVVLKHRFFEHFVP